MATPDPELTSLHVRRAVDGSSDSLSWLVARLSPLLRAQAEYRLGPLLRPIHDAEDLVHEAWLVTLPKLGELPPRDGRMTPVLLRFLCTSMLHIVQNLVRKHARAGMMTADENVARQLEDPRSGVVTRAMRTEERDVVRECIEQLEERDREVLLLRGIEQQANNTVAMLLDMQPAAVAMRYQRALARLRKRLPGSVFEELADEA